MSHAVAFDISGSIVRVVLSVRHVPIDSGARGYVPVVPEAPLSRAENALILFLKEAPLLAAPWIFNDSENKRRVYCLLFEYDDMDVVLAKGIYYTGYYAQVTKQTFVTRVSTMGSQAKAFESLLLQKLEDYNLNLRSKWTLPPLQAVVIKRRELESVTSALQFFQHHLASCVYSYKSTRRFITDSNKDPSDTEYITCCEENNFELYPYLLVNMKAGVSFHKVTSETEFKRVGGSTIGMATFLGLAQEFCGSSTSPYDMILQSDLGNQTSVDMLVEDIYGCDYGAIGLAGSMVASSFGLLQHVTAKKKKDTAPSPVSGGSLKPFPSFTLEADGSPRAAMDLPTGAIGIAPAEDKNYVAFTSPRMRPASGKPSNDGSISLTIPCLNPANKQAPPIKHSASTQSLANSNTSSSMGNGPRACIDLLDNDAAELDLPTRQLGKPVWLNGLKVVSIFEKDESRYVFTNRLVNDRGADGQTANPCPPKTCEVETPVYKTDIYKSLLSMTSFNIAQLAYLNARIHGCTRIIFIGYYVDMPETLAAIQHCIKFWSQDEVKVNFVRVAPYLGAIGSALSEARRQGA